MRVALLLFILVCGCVRSESVQCATGILCPPGHECDDANNRCVSPEQLLQCAGMLDRHPCTVAGVPGECATGVCEPRFCGDGMVSSGESCEGTNLGTATCRDAGFYKPEGLACSSFCTFDVTNCQERCGDGFENGPELCDYMAAIAPSETCRDIGYDVGYVTCNSGCGFELSGCGRVGWRFMASTVSNEYYAMHASSATNVWAVGERVQPVRFDGTQWIETSTGAAENDTSSDIYSIEPNLAWLVDDASNVFTFDGTGWSEMTTAPADAVAVFATASNDVWVATTANDVKRWNGSAWIDTGALAQSDLSEIDGSGPNDVWVSTSDGTAHHWNGSTWTPATIITGNSIQVRDLWVRSPTEAYAVGTLIDTVSMAFLSRWDGNTWTSSTTSIDTAFYSISGTGPKDLWVNGSGGPSHFDGSSWFAAPYPGLTGDLSQCYSTGTGDTFAVTSTGAAIRHDGLVYGRFDPPIAPSFAATWGSPSGHVFAADSATTAIAHFDGTQWLTPQNAFAGNIYGIWGSAHDSVWAVGSAGKPTFFNGTSWTQSTIANTQQLYAVWGSNADNVWAAGVAGTVIYYNGATWTHRNIPGASPATDIRQLAGTGPDDVWALSITGILYRWNGAWSIVSAPPGTSAIQGLLMRAPGEPMVFQGSRLYQFTAGAWVEQSFPLTQSPPIRFATNGSNEVFGLTTTELFHFDGTRWSPLAFPDEMLGKQAYGFGSVTNRRVDIFFREGAGYMRPLLRIRPWVCTPVETVCNDSVDNDCDDKIDERDSDCP